MLSLFSSVMVDSLTIVHNEGDMLTLIKPLEERSKDNHIMWLCQCDCGHVGKYRATRVRAGKVSQCRDCAVKVVTQKIKKHGMRNSPEYRIWVSMKSRCKSKRLREQKGYVKKGIEVCDEWKNSFESFFNYIGKRPSEKHSIDRIDNRLGYQPGNVRWALPFQQQRNKDVSTYVTDGKNKFHIIEVAQKLGITKGAAHLRLKRGKLHGYSKIA